MDNPEKPVIRHRIQNRVEQNKYTTQVTEIMSNKRPIEKPGMNAGAREW